MAKAPSPPAEGRAGPGIIAPPPLLYLAFFIAGLGAHALHPWPIFPRLGGTLWIGLVFVALGGGLARWAFVTLKRLGTSANPRKDSLALAVEGPFRRSRNPIYLAMSLLYVGAAFLFNALPPLMLLGPLLAVMDWGVIQREEAYLIDTFGDPYRAYQRRVGRWF